MTQHEDRSPSGLLNNFFILAWNSTPLDPGSNTAFPGSVIFLGIYELTCLAGRRANQRKYEKLPFDVLEDFCYSFGINKRGKYQPS
jgi:hypothetical protein